MAKASSLADLEEYQEGSVVSRTLVDKKSGTVTLFAFDKGQGLSERTAPFDAFVYATEGKVKVTIAGNRFELSAGDAIIMPANQPHALQATDRFRMMLVVPCERPDETFGQCVASAAGRGCVALGRSSAVATIGRWDGLRQLADGRYHQSGHS